MVARWSSTQLYPPGYVPQRKAHLHGPAMKCGKQCPHGSACCLNGSIPHTLHVCSSPSCPCHGSARYAEARRALMQERDG